jgi:predicted MPP superfamily phosphohydrolase
MHKNGKNLIWDCFCVASIIGIWPRFIEPNLLSVTELSLPIRELPPELVGLKILQLSDLHWNQNFSSYFLKKLHRKISCLKPDLIVFTGDFLSRSKLQRKNELKQFLCSLKAPLGCFAVLGNHDYEKFVTINEKGEYDIDSSSKSDVFKGFKRLFNPIKPVGILTHSAQQIEYHQELIELLQKTPFQLLNNSTQLVKFRGTWINICGIEEYTTGHFNLLQAFKHYDSRYVGIILSHNPDAIPQLLSYPGEIILCGHTHGGQINLPFIGNRLTGIENFCFKRGLKQIHQKWIYVNRGIGGVFKFRWFSIPELSVITLQTGTTSHE